MKLDLYQVDAFTERLFSGNPAAVCPLDAWLPDDLMQRIAAENNLSETAFFVPRGDAFDLRWFTPTTEVELCGHATLAAAFVIWEFMGATGTLEFGTRSGRLRVDRVADRIVLDFPARPLEDVSQVPQALIDGLGAAPAAILASGSIGVSGFYVALYPTEGDVRELRPDMRLLASLTGMGVVATSVGEASDFVCRCFAPAFGIPEDPVTGSIHCFLAPYWSARLSKDVLRSRQVSERGGDLRCELKGSRVRIGGRAVCYLVGSIEVPDTKRRPS